MVARQAHQEDTATCYGALLPRKNVEHVAGKLWESRACKTPFKEKSECAWQKRERSEGTGSAAEHPMGSKRGNSEGLHARGDSEPTRRCIRTGLGAP